MRIGFEVILETDRKAEFNLFPLQQPSKESLITFAQDSTTEIAAVLMGRIYYQDDLNNHFPEAFEQDLTSDAALVLAIFRHYGSKGIKQLEGEFALVIFDPKKQCLFTLRDPLGSYPLYWISDGKTMRVSTNLKLLVKQIIFRWWLLKAVRLNPNILMEMLLPISSGLKTRFQNMMNPILACST